MDLVQTALAGYLVFGQLIPQGQQEIVKHAGLQAIHSDGAVTLRLRETGREESQDGAARTVRISLADEHYPFEVVRYVKSWSDCPAVETWVEVRHSEPGPVKLLRADSFAAPVDCAAREVRVLSLTGKWAYEANVSEAPVANGQIVELASKAGTRDAWESNAAMMVSFGDAGEDYGNVLGVALEWTGTTCRRVRRSWDGDVTEVFAGIDMTTGPYTLDPGRTFTTPRAVLVWSESGRGGVSRGLHRWARSHCMPHGRDLHPILLNSWEGSYFSFTEKTLTDMMDGVRELGGEMFVLDDGWFGRGKYARDDRNRDTTGLGDWTVNGEKLPRGLGWLAGEANARGLKFGLWVEPEMVNTKSWLAEEHPDWILREANRPLALGRGGSQVVLDMTNPAVRDNLFGQLDAVYSTMPTLAYVKWDSNQNIVNPGSKFLPADRQPNLWYDYTVGLYELLAKLQAKRPGVMVQACASGGGHMDYGFLRYADEFWTSDDTDPYQRVFIQWGASQFYPACAMACHVTASPNHQTKRETPLKYRFDVAMTGRMGFELHPKDLSADELAFAKAAVETYKRIRPVVQQGDLYRLASPYENPYSSLMYVNDDRSRAVVFVLGLDGLQGRRVAVKLAGLDPSKSYSLEEINCGKKRHAAKLDGTTLQTRLLGQYDSAVFELALRR
ncbi:MAG: alpha-galactosidase [Kiritimatiellae bacterium]|nr:alpha-galactosidase [Kiritimatiellia bacterium]